MCDEPEIKESINLEKNTTIEFIPFWANDPNILFNPKYILEFFPIQHMSYEQQLNSISRLIVLLTIIGFVFFQRIRLLIVFIITMGLVWFMYYYHTKENFENNPTLNDLPSDDSNLEPNNIVKTILENNNIDISSNVFDVPTSVNPFSNILITDYEYNKSKKPAPPCNNENVSTNIIKEVKQMIINNNLDQPDISKKLFKDMGDEFTFEQSMHSFHTTPNTTIPNDQNGFAEFCYGNMTSCKEGNLFACARNLSRYQNY